jgi:choice-of-anchor B domain-containing protein
MTKKPTYLEIIATGEIRRTIQSALRMSVLACAVVALPFAARADNPESAHNHASGLGHATGSELEVKRVGQTGKGMPSIEGPFPDTVQMEYLGQLTNDEMGVSRLVFTGASFLSDIWGWTAPCGDPPNCNEYAIVGTSSGVAFVRITNPQNPQFLGLVPTTDTSTTRNFWWDIKTYNNHAYWVTEVNNAGVAIFDLTRLEDMEPVSADTTLNANARYDGKGYIRAHNISINEDTGYAYLSGVSKDSSIDPGFTDNGMIILDLTKPKAPKEVGQILNIDSHDAQIVNYEGDDTDMHGVPYNGREIAFLFNGSDLDMGIYDVTVKDHIKEISVTTYNGASYAHQGWLTDDHQYLLMGDEEDELFGVSDPKNAHLPDTSRTYIWDIKDLDKPEIHGTYDSPAAAIDHNLFVKGDRVYQANYTAGVRVLEIDRSGGGLSLKELAHMDTEPRLPNKKMNHNINIFIGPWGVYPFFDSGTIIASDGLNGLIITRVAE